MAIVTATNSTTPNVVKWASTDPDIYDRATQLAGLAENFDLHDHDAGKNLGVKRLQTTVAPNAAGHVRVNADDLQWWGASAAAIRTALSAEGTQTISGVKTFSGGIVVSAGGIAVTGGVNIATAGLIVGAGGAQITGGISTTSGVTATTGDVTVTAGNLIFGAASARIIPGATSLLVRDTANANTNLGITDAGAVTVRAGLTVSTVGVAVSAGGVAVAGGVNISTGGLVVQAGDVAIGTTPSTFGQVRLPNTGAVYARNVSNSADVHLLSLDASNFVRLGNSAQIRIGFGAGSNTIIGDAAAGVGFFNSGGAGKQTPSGSRGGNAALASLLSALATYGLIQDGTSA